MLSAPLEIRIMKSEIESRLEVEPRDYLEELNKKDQKEFDARKAELKQRRDATQGRLDERVSYFEIRRQEIQRQRRERDLEAEGISFLSPSMLSLSSGCWLF